MTEAASLPVCYYNGACPICRAEIKHYRRTSDGARVIWRDLARDPEALHAFGIDPRRAKRRLHVVDGDGRLLCGIDAFILIWQAMPRYRWLGRLVARRPLRSLAAALYDKVLAPLLYYWNRRRGLI